MTRVILPVLKRRIVAAESAVRDELACRTYAFSSGTQQQRRTYCTSRYRNNHCCSSNTVTSSSVHSLTTKLHRPTSRTLSTTTQDKKQINNKQNKWQSMKGPVLLGVGFYIGVMIMKKILLKDDDEQKQETNNNMTDESTKKFTKHSEIFNELQSDLFRSTQQHVDPAEYYRYKYNIPKSSSTDNNYDRVLSKSGDENDNISDDEKGSTNKD